jgi:hypothetical protein
VFPARRRVWQPSKSTPVKFEFVIILKTAKELGLALPPTLAGDANHVNVFRRFAFMKGLHQVERVSFDRMVDPGDETRLHQSDWATDRVAGAVWSRSSAASTRHGHR